MPFVSDHIRTTAADGMVTLESSVHSWVEREKAERTAWAAPGVVEVENRIVINP